MTPDDNFISLSPRIADAAGLQRALVRKSKSGHGSQLLTMKSKSHAPPTRDEISPTHGLSLDEASAVAAFLGKTQDEAVELFKGPSFLRYENMMWMGPNAFIYYLPAAIAAAQQDLTSGDSSSVSWLCCAIETQLQQTPAVAPMVKSYAGEFCAFVMANWQSNSIDPTHDDDILDGITRLLRQTQESEPP